jgi:hypothetical protein
LAVLNELSLPTQKDTMSDGELVDVLDKFVTMLRAARRIRPDLALVSPVPLASLPVGGQRTLGAFVGAQGGRALESWRFVRQLRNHAPSAAAPGLRLANSDEEYRHGGNPAMGLGLAGANRQLAVSLQPQMWDEALISLDRVWLTEADNGELIERTEERFVYHAASPGHIESHHDFLRGLALPEPFGGRDLWDDRAVLFPHMAFLDRVEDQLIGSFLSGEKLNQVAIRLAELEAAAAEWCSGDAVAPHWRSKVTTESEQRKDLCYFADLDGERRSFDLHARFTPGAGRIHFRLTGRDAMPQIVVAHVGRKLGI